MYYVNKIVWFFVNPLMAPLAAAVAGFALAAFARRRRWRMAGFAALAAALACFWFESTFACIWLLGGPLERPYLATQTPDSLPDADAIVLLGGGIAKVDGMAYPDMSDGSDRVWHAARLWKAGKAPLIVVSGRNDLEAAVPLLADFGVPREAIAVDNDSRNTYENSRFTERLLAGRAAQAGGGRRILLVTSAWHMPRAQGNFAKTSLEVVPAAADFKVHNLRAMAHHWFDWVMPGPGAMDVTNFLAKEWLGKLARR